MYVAGIVAEFNPFHKGHAYLIKEARIRGATHIAVAMSGATVQRGEPAICPKHERAAAAIANGADLVVELPSPYSCSAAPFFADAAVQILVQLGINALAFGSEYESPDLLSSAADALAKLSDSGSVHSLTAEGLPYPAALRQAAEEKFGAEIGGVISSPNSTLAVEYISALQKYSRRTDLLPIKRQGAGHDSKPEGGFASGSYLREKILSGEGSDEYIPRESTPKTVCSPETAEKIIYYGLLSANRERLLTLPEINEQLADRILKAAKDPPERLADFLLSVKSRNFTLARIRRSALHLTLGVTKADFFAVPYIRILAFNQHGAEILKCATPDIPISTSLKELEYSSSAAKRISSIELNAVKLMQMCTGNFENEYTRKIVMTK